MFEKTDSADAVYGTRTLVKQLRNSIAEAVMIAGHAAGEDTFQEYP